MLDFTSASYLGLEHRKEDLAAWSSLSTGKPAALWEPEPAIRLADEIARLQGCEAGLVAASTLHLFWDVQAWAGQAGMRVFLDAGVYPVAASVVGAVAQFRHRDLNDLERVLRIGGGGGGRGRPLVVVDGFCVACGSIYPYADLLACVRREGGLVLVDDTQALGIFGTPARGFAYGRGGGGSLRRAGLEREEDVLSVSSLAKAFGAPLAALSGPRELVRQFAAASRSRVHCTPPSMASVAAGLAALEWNRRDGDQRRARLAALVERLKPRRGLFPYQTISHPAAWRLYQTLRAAGIETVPLAGADGSPRQLGVAITAQHQPSGIDALARRMNQFLEEPCLACT